MLNILNKRLIIKYNNLRRLCSTQSKRKTKYSVPYVIGFSTGIIIGIIIPELIIRKKLYNK